MTYEELLEKAQHENILVLESVDFESHSDGLINGDVIGLSSNLVTSIHKACVLAEELGHYHTTVGNILDQSTVANRKQELHARAWAYQKGLRLCDIIKASKYGCRNRYEIADYLNVTEEFLQAGIEYFKGKYGPYVKYENYTVYFEPLGVLELF